MLYVVAEIDSRLFRHVETRNFVLSI